MKIVYIATYPPRQCGIGTFTHNKFMAMICGQTNMHERHEGIVVAISDQDNEYDYPDEVKFTIRQNEQSDYMDAASFINNCGADICILEHEFGIFGGQNGVYLLPLLHRLKIPVIAVFHTVLKNPSYSQKSILTTISKMAAKTVVMTQKAVEFLTNIYGVPAKDIEIIGHGVPGLQFDQHAVKRELGLENSRLLLTFGLIGRNKGIETVIKALPEVVSKHPEVVYIILGKTHPSIVKHSGEEYRDYLMQLISERQLEKHVIFMNEFVNEEKLFKYLTATDIYVTPYLNEAQITSGTLSYAVGAGCAVVSTPYWHAAELLPVVGGKLFGFNDDKQLASIFMDLLDHPAIMKEMSRKAYAHGREITWPKIGERFITLAKKQLKKIPGRKTVSDLMSFPSLSMDHVRRMTDHTGIIQHAKYGIPNFKEGYCLDDNARALLMVLMAYKQQKHFVSIELLRVYLGYIHYMQNDDGTFHNFLSYSRNFLDEKGSEDSFGRTIWALGYLIANPPAESYHQMSREIFFKAGPNFRHLHSLRGIANTLIGVCLYLQTDPYHPGMNEVARELSGRLMKEYTAHKSENWNWFEPVLTYDNAVLPLGLLHAGSVLDDQNIIEVAEESMNFLSEITLKNGYLSIIGNEKWYAKGAVPSVFAQQPIDAMMMVLLFQKAFEVTGKEIYIENLDACFMWFLGENDLRMNLYDSETKGCHDGLENYGVNHNQGAESTLAYLISHIALLETFEETEELPVSKDVVMKSKELVSVNMAG